MRLEGMPIVVTGATGIARAGAERFTAEGAQTILTLTGGINVSMGVIAAEAAADQSPNNAHLAMANGVLVGFATGPVNGLGFAYSRSTH
jgi:NAD(P)-dependent dehydrogenase (short-subunit alcohol dehydrogenase family)